MAQLDPLHLERDRGEVWRPLTRPARLTVVGAPAPRVGLVAMGGVMLAAALSVGTTARVRRLSDTLGISRAVEQRDWPSLASYVSQQGPLDARADQAWFDMAIRAPGEDELIAYIHSPSLSTSRDDNRAQRLQRHVASDRLLARRVLRRASRGIWRESAPSQVTPPPLEANEHPESRRTLDLDDTVALLERYLGLSVAAEQPLRPLVERRLFELKIAQSDERFHCPSSPALLTRGQARSQDSDPLTPYLEQSSEQGQQARAARWRQLLVQADRCRSLASLETARARITTPDQQTEFANAWRAFFEARRAETSRVLRTTYNAVEVPQPLLEQLDALWAYLAAHPETRMGEATWPWESWRNQETDPDHDWWIAMMRPSHDWLSHERTDTLLHALRTEVPPEIMRWKVRHDGPHLDVRWFNPPTEGRLVIELTLALPGSPARPARFQFTPRSTSPKDGECAQGCWRPSPPAPR